MTYWSVNCWCDMGDRESGPLIHTYREVIKAETAKQAWESVSNGRYTCNENNVMVPDIRPATELEIDEYEMERREEEEFKAQYGYYPWEWQPEGE